MRDLSAVDCATTQRRRDRDLHVPCVIPLEQVGFVQHGGSLSSAPSRGSSLVAQRAAAAHAPQSTDREPCPPEGASRTISSYRSLGGSSCRAPIRTARSGRRAIPT